MTGVGKLCLKNVNYSDIVVTGHALSLSTGWRLRLCNCSHCAVSITFILLNEFDVIHGFIPFRSMLIEMASSQNN